MEIKKVAIIGSGVMGAGIAAHLANAGIPSLLLDIVPKFTDEDAKAGLKETDQAFRNKIALGNIQQFVLKFKPSLIYSKRDAKLITAGNTEDDIGKLKECDWVVEAVTEQLKIKQIVFANVEKNIRPGTIVSSNTSGLPLSEMAAGRGVDFRKNFIVTHFFNPVRYMKLVEVVSSKETNPEALALMVDFLENKLGKGVVYAKDTPNFIANRIGIYSWMASLHQALEKGLSVEQIDKICGPALGRPKSAVLRTGDMVGLDTLVHVAQNTYDLCPKDEGREVFKIPSILTNMIEKKWLGDKTRQGFYKKTKTPDGKKAILSLDLKSMEYKPQEKVAFESLKAAKGIEDVGERIKAMVEATDEAGQFAWKQISEALIYSANRVPEIADDVVNVDNGMKWGFNWDLGPFETWDAIGVKSAVDRLKKEGKEIPSVVQSVLDNGDGVFYKQDGSKKLFFDIASKSYKPVPTKATSIVIQTLKDEKKELKSNASATLLDLGDGVLCAEFHTKMNAIDGDIGNMLNEALDLLEKDNSWQGLVIGNDGQNFSAGANLMLLWLESQQKNWAGIEKLVKEFQDVTMRTRFSSKPVVAAPFGMALGGGCEVVMGCDAVRAYGELYMGLVEIGAGLIPGGGGNKNLLLNIEEARKAKGPMGWAGKSDGGPFPKVQDTFQTIAFAKVSTSCKEAIECKYLSKNRTQISLSRDSLLNDAKQDVLRLAKDYQPPKQREDILVPGEGGLMAIENALSGFQAQGMVTDHDMVVASKLAYVLCGGKLPHQGYVSEQYLLDVEREAFLSLCGEEKSQARMQHLLTKGKPLRN
jgi:3-hydroxyacyl-CoA dehydrogenase